MCHAASAMWKVWFDLLNCGRKRGDHLLTDDLPAFTNQKNLCAAPEQASGWSPRTLAPRSPLAHLQEEEGEMEQCDSVVGQCCCLGAIQMVAMDFFFLARCQLWLSSVTPFISQCTVDARVENRGRAPWRENRLNYLCQRRTLFGEADSNCTALVDVFE